MCVCVQTGGQDDQQETQELTQLIWTQSIDELDKLMRGQLNLLLKEDKDIWDEYNRIWLNNQSRRNASPIWLAVSGIRTTIKNAMLQAKVHSISVTPLLAISLP